MRWWLCLYLKISVWIVRHLYLKASPLSTEPSSTNLNPGSTLSFLRRTSFQLISIMPGIWNQVFFLATFLFCFCSLHFLFPGLKYKFKCSLNTSPMKLRSLHGENPSDNEAFQISICRCADYFLDWLPLCMLQSYQSTQWSQIRKVCGWCFWPFFAVGESYHTLAH